MKLQWSEGCGDDGERTVSISDQTLTYYASVPVGMTIEEAAAEFMSDYDHNGSTCSVQLSCELWEAYSDDLDPDETEEITYDESDFWDIINQKRANSDGTIGGNGLWIAEADEEEKRCFEQRSDARRVAEEVSNQRKLKAAEEAYAAAEGQWDGLTWTKLFPFAFGDFEAEVDAEAVAHVNRFDDDAVDEAVSEMMSGWDISDKHLEKVRDACRTAIVEAIEYADGVAADAARAEQAGKDAIEAARQGDFDAALSFASEASGIESEYGDNPTWGPLYEALYD